MDEIPLLADERLFTRDLEGHLLRMDKPTAAMLDDSDDKKIKLMVDGEEVKLPKAVPATDPEGGILYDERRQPIPRLTTILDAVSKRYAPAPNPVPVLCHREHMNPAAGCSICVVQVSGLNKRSGKVEVDPKLSPACHQPIVEGMIVETIAALGDGKPTQGAKRVKKTVKLLIELLAANHLHKGAHPANELEALAERLREPTEEPAEASARFQRDDKYRSEVAPKADSYPKIDHTSPWFMIDRTACILCDRCVRSCGEVRGHFVLARAGKGADARIAFDWDHSMGDSACVQCGECFINCPTDAITMRKGVKPSPWEEEETPKPGIMMGWLGQLLRFEDPFNGKKPG